MISASQQRDGLDLLRRLNQLSADRHPGDTELQARLNSYDLAYRMESAAPEAVDVSKETAATKDLYHLPPEEDAKIPTVCHSLDQALEYLDKDRAFLTKGGVFTDAYIDAYIELKMQEVTRFRMATHPVEFDMYYSL